MVPLKPGCTVRHVPCGPLRSTRIRCMPAVGCRHRSVLQWLPLGVNDSGARFSLAWLLLQTAQNASTRRSMRGEAGYLRGSRSAGRRPAMFAFAPPLTSASWGGFGPTATQEAPVGGRSAGAGRAGSAGSRRTGAGSAPGGRRICRRLPGCGQRRSASGSARGQERRCAGACSTRAAQGAPDGLCQRPVDHCLVHKVRRCQVLLLARTQHCEHCLHHTDLLGWTRRLHDRSGNIKMSSSGGPACRTWRDGPSKVAPSGCVQSARARSSLCGGPVAQAMMIYEQHGLRAVTMPPRTAAARSAGPQQSSA